MFTCACVYTQKAHATKQGVTVPCLQQVPTAWPGKRLCEAAWVDSPRDRPSTGFWASSVPRHTEKQGGDCPLPSSQPISPPTGEGPYGAFLCDTSGALRHTQRSPLCPLAPKTLPAFSVCHGPSPWGQKPPSLTRFWSQKPPAWMARPDHRTPDQADLRSSGHTSLLCAQTRTSQLP